MNIINVDAETFEQMLSKFESFAKRMETLCRVHGNKENREWLDNQDVCMILNISKRSLQNYRDNGTLPYTQIGHKMFYRADDIERIVPVITQKEKELTYKRKERK